MNSAGRATDSAANRTVALLGLDGTGLTLALAFRLARPTWRILGWDDDAERTNLALRSRAIDGRLASPPTAAREADILVLSQPLGRLLTVLEGVAPHLRPGTLVTDTAPLKLPVLAHAAEHLPSGVTFVGGHPVLRRGAGPSAMALHGATYCLTPAPGSNEGAVRLVVELVTACGAEPYFVEAAEHDALVVGAMLMPALVRGVQLGLLAQSPSARDIERLREPQTADEWSELTAWLAEAGGEVVAARETALHWLDRLLDELQSWRQALALGDAATIERQVAAVRQALSSWPPSARDRGPDADDLENAGLLRQALFGRLFVPRRPPPDR